MKQWLDAVCHIAKEAGQAILPYFNQDKHVLKTRHKADKSPVTDADIAAHDIICSGLHALAPTLPILSEEDANLLDYEQRKQWQRYWLIDPLDGTRGFIAGIPEFSVNIALIECGEPIMGVIYSPTDDLLYAAYDAEGAFRQDGSGCRTSLTTRCLNWQQYTFAVGQYHNEKRLQLYAQEHPNFSLLRLNSSLKFCAIAEGRADIYPRIGPTGEWDTAAGQCILEQAGGLVVDLQANPLQYNARESVINGAFVALGDTDALDQTLLSIQRGLS